MPKKLTYEEVKCFIEITSNSDCKLQSTKEDYINTLTKITINCSCGEPFVTSFKEFKYLNKRQCNKCGYEKAGHSKRLSFKEVKNYIEVESKSNYKLLSTEYLKSSIPLSMECAEGHIFPMNLNNFKKGKRCPYCYGNAKYTYKQVKQIFKDNDCELLSKTYTDNKQLLDYICECGNQSKITLSHFLDGERCQICKSKKIGDALRMSFDEVFSIFKEQGCELLTKQSEYTGADKKLKYKCSCGNESFIRLPVLVQGGRCKLCENIRKKKTSMKNWGVENPMQNMLIRAKANQSFYKNGTAPCSSQQKYLHFLFGGELNYPFSNLLLDIALPDEKIYIEYDGGGHDLNVKLKHMTQKQFDLKEIKRSRFIMSQEWKEIRIISSTDKLPPDKKLLEMLDYAKQYLSTGHHYIKFDIDESCPHTRDFNRELGQIKYIC